MSAHAYELPGEDPVLDRLADEAGGGEVIYLTRDGRRVAALVPADVAEALEAAEDAEDLAAARAALASPGRRIPHEKVLAEFADVLAEFPA